MTVPPRSAVLRTRFAPLLALAALLVFSAGCQIIPEPAADPTRFFVLTVPDRAPAAVPEGSLRLGLRSIELPAYLKSRSLVVRNGRNEIAYQDYARWAEPLDDGIARVLRARLVASPAVARVYSHPFPFDRARDYDIGVSVIRCEGTRGPDGDVARFAAVVEIVESATGNVLSRRAIVVPDLPWDGSDHAALVEALSTAVGRLADEVVAQLPAAAP